LIFVGSTVVSRLADRGPDEACLVIMNVAHPSVPFSGGSAVTEVAKSAGVGMCPALEFRERDKFNGQCKNCR
jgi:hypothetical protein